MPSARSDRPVTSSRRTPTSATSRAPATADPTSAVPVVGSQARPVVVGEYSRTCCISSEARKMKENIAPNAKNADRLAATSVRFFTAVGGTSGVRAREFDTDERSQQHGRCKEQQQRR